MTEIAVRRRPWIDGRPALLTLLLLGGGLLLWGRSLDHTLPPADWWAALTQPDKAAYDQILVHYSLLPRLCVALLCGAALGLAGVLFQQVLRNPLAEPGTLGVFAGAKLAVTLATLVGVGGLSLAQESVALAGGSGTLALVLLLSWRGRLSPLVVILAGLIVTLYLDALARTLMLFNHAALTDLFVWQGGSLAQNTWDTATYLLPRLLAGAAISIALIRPLTLLDLDDEGARGLGLSLASTRLLAICVAVLLSAFVVSAVGVISFIGLAGPAIARHAGARRFVDRLLWGPLIAAGLLVLTDQAVQIIDHSGAMPTGAVTAILGAPLLLYFLRALAPSTRPAQGGPGLFAPPLSRPWLAILGGLVLLGLILWAALAFGRIPAGWRWSTGAELTSLLPWRVPRVIAALAAGWMLAVAGVLLQRVTANALASPELLGVSSGAALALIVVAFVAPGLGRPGMIAVAALGAGLTLLAILTLGRKSAFAPEHLLLAGVALSMIQGSLMALVLFAGDPRTALLLGWLSGSTYGVTLEDARITLAVALALGALSPLVARWLAILPLGTATSQALGVDGKRSRLALLVLTALLTAAATVAVGPLSFVGLMAPHMARLMGIHRPLPQLAAAGLLGSAIMVAADWAGRMIAFPWQVPAGLVATLLGGTYFLWLMQRRKA